MTSTITKLSSSSLSSSGALIIPSIMFSYHKNCSSSLQLSLGSLLMAFFLVILKPCFNSTGYTLKLKHCSVVSIYTSLVSAVMIVHIYLQIYNVEIILLYFFLSFKSSRFNYFLNVNPF